MVVATTQTELKKQPVIAFGDHASLYLKQYAQLSDRALFYYLINADEFYSVGPYALQYVEKCLKRTQLELDKSDTILSQRLLPFDYTRTAFSERIAQLSQSAKITYLGDNTLSKDQLHTVLKQCAPTALLDGCWLQNISLAANNHTEITSRLFRIYTQKIGDGNVSSHYGNVYRNLLLSAQIQLPEITSRLFTTYSDFCDTAFSSPVFQLAISLFPRLYLPELIGFTLGHLLFPQNRLLVDLLDNLQQHGLDTRYCEGYAASPSCDRDMEFIQDAVELYLKAFENEAERQQQWQRIWRGLIVHHLIDKPRQDDLRDLIKQPKTLTPHEKMLAMVREKAPLARNMHRNRKVGGSLINDWFAQEPFDAEGFLKALAASPFVNLKSPLESSLITRSIEFGGPMFRIFTDTEQAVIAEWLQSLAANPPLSNTASEPVIESLPVIKPVAMPTDPDDSAHIARYAKCNKRQLYYYFVNADLFPDILPTARKVAEQYFKKARVEMARRSLSEQLKWFPYDHDAFEQRIKLIYQTETNAYEKFIPPSTVPREIMVWFIQQYAPFPMVDGSWVQHIAKAGVSHTDVSARLFRIYSDEVGNADTRLNHPTIYRHMLEKEGIHMPPTDTLEFAMQPAIRNFAFDLPLLTLSASMFPKSFLPEIIGINLAIELSGLGKGYMQIIDELKFWKIDPYFFVLHLTIDNIASGHTAVAMETVHIYLDNILCTQGQQAMQREWKRIWTGYLAFKHNMTRFDATLEREAGLRFLLPLIRLKMTQKKEKKRQQASH